MWTGENDAKTLRVDANFLEKGKKSCVFKRIRVDRALASLTIAIDGLPAYSIQKLQRVQKSAARLVFEESKICRITPLLRALHWLPVAYRRVFKIILLSLKAIHKLAPTYISEPVSTKDTGGRYCLSSNDGILLSIPACKSFTTLGDRSIYMAVSKLWNDLSFFNKNRIYLQ